MAKYARTYIRRYIQTPKKKEGKVGEKGGQKRRVDQGRKKEK